MKYKYTREGRTETKISFSIETENNTMGVISSEQLFSLRSFVTISTLPLIVSGLVCLFSYTLIYFNMISDLWGIMLMEVIDCLVLDRNRNLQIILPSFGSFPRSSICQDITCENCLISLYAKKKKLLIYVTDPSNDQLITWWNSFLC